jgi:hypothetical protein
VRQAEAVSFPAVGRRTLLGAIAMMALNGCEDVDSRSVNQRELIRASLPEIRVDGSGQLIIASARNPTTNSVEIFRCGPNRAATRLRLEKRSFSSPAISEDGQKVALVEVSQTGIYQNYHVGIVESGVYRRVWSSHDGAISALAFNKSTTRLAFVYTTAVLRSCVAEVDLATNEMSYFSDPYTGFSYIKRINYLSDDHVLFIGTIASDRYLLPSAASPYKRGEAAGTILLFKQDRNRAPALVPVRPYSSGRAPNIYEIAVYMRASGAEVYFMEQSLDAPFEPKGSANYEVFKLLPDLSWLQVTQLRSTNLHFDLASAASTLLVTHLQPDETSAGLLTTINLASGLSSTKSLSRLLTVN